MASVTITLTVIYIFIATFQQLQIQAIESGCNETYTGGECCKCFPDYKLHLPNGTCVETCGDEYEQDNPTDAPNCNSRPESGVVPYSDRFCGCKDPFCQNCSGITPGTCTSCMSGRFLHIEQEIGQTNCDENCKHSYYKNYDNGECTKCTDKLKYCKDDGCTVIDSALSVTSDCQKYCKNQAPQAFSTNANATIVCIFPGKTPDQKDCKEDAFLVDDCQCCVKKCPAELEEKEGVCVVIGPCGRGYLHCIVGAVVGGVALLLVVVTFVLCCCYCKRRRERPKKAKKLPPSAETVDATLQKRNRSSRQRESEDPSPPQPPPMRKESNRLLANEERKPHDYENMRKPTVTVDPREVYTDANSAHPGNDENYIAVEPGTPEEPHDYENKNVIENLRINKLKPGGSRNASPANQRRGLDLHQNVPPVEQDNDYLPPLHTQVNPKGYINQNIIEKHEKEMKKNTSKKSTRDDSGCFDNNLHPDDNDGTRDSLYINTSTSNIATPGLSVPGASEDYEGDDAGGDYLPMDGRDMKKIIQNKLRNDQNQKFGSNPALNRPKPPAKPGKGLSHSNSDRSIPHKLGPAAAQNVEQEVYMDMTGAAAFRNQNGRPSGVKKPSPHMDREVPASVSTRHKKGPHYYNDNNNQQELYSNLS